MSDINLKTITFPQIGNKYLLGDPTLSISGTGADAKATGDALETKANTDGSYESMTVGNAEQLVSNVRVNDKTPYLFRTSGGSVDIGDREYVNGITGVSLPWNQLVLETQLSDHHVVKTFVDGKINLNGTASGAASIGLADALNAPNHKMLVLSSNIAHEHIRYFFRDGTNSANIKLVGYSTEVGDFVYAVPSTCTNLLTYCIIDSGTELNNFKFRFQVFDLTQLFGSTIADYIYSLETATAGAGVAWFKKLFNKPYYAYNAGTLKHVEGLVSHDMNGFNQWDEEWEQGDISASTGQNTTNTNTWRSKNYIHILPSTEYYVYVPSISTNPSIRPRYYDSNKDFIGTSPTATVGSTFITPPNAYYLRFAPDASYIPNHDVCISINWDGSRHNEYEPYVKHSYPLDSSVVLRGIPKLDANNSLYYDGDVYEPDGTVNRRYGIVDLGTLTWGYQSETQRFIVDIVGAKRPASNFVSANILCPKYVTIPSRDTESSTGNMCIGLSQWGTLGIRDESRGTSASDFKTAMSGVYLVYELATPTTETADPYTSPQIVNDFGTEEYVFGDSAFPIPVGHNTDYPIDLKAKVEMAPNSPDGDGDYIVRQVNGENSYVPLVIEDALPTVPSTAGSYKLTVTVADGSDPVLAWTQA